MSDEDFLRQLREAFAIEADEHLRAIISGLLDLEKSPDAERQRELVEMTFREAHSLKGAARAVNRTDIESVCQSMETVFAGWKRNAVSGSTESFDVLNDAADVVGKLLKFSEVAQAPPEKSAIIEIVRRLGQITGSSRRIAPAAKPPKPVEKPSPPPESARVSAAILAAPSLVPPPPPPPEKLQVTETVRVPMAKMDKLLLQAEELVGVKLATKQHFAALREVGDMVESWRTEWAKLRDLHGREEEDRHPVKVASFLEWNQSFMKSLERKLTSATKAIEQGGRIIEALINDLLEHAKQLVMLPFATLLDLFPKLVRDLARAQGKEIELVIRGRDVEIDKRILEEMKDPLIHLVRNSVDHGIEKPEVRAEGGKAPRGTLTIAVSQREGNKVELMILDDGRGIDVERVKSAAIEGQIVSAEEAAQLSEEAALALIFRSGISTSPIITELSGRGLGMAIVREKVEKLGGQITVGTRAQVGTSFRILLPVTLATFKGILVNASGQTFVIPTSSVERIIRVKRTEIMTLENRETIGLNGQAISLAWLAAVLELPAGKPDATDFLEIVVLGVGDNRIGFAVDAVLDEQEVLVKNLGKPLLRVRNVAGATVLGSGTAAIILNVPDLLKSAVNLAAIARRPQADAVQEAVATRRILVTDDSITSRMLIKNILEGAGYDVATAMDGVEALTLLRSRGFDLVVSDVEMPRMDGFELTTKVRADKHLADLPVVLVTALSSREDQERGIDVGANAYIVKSSFDQSDLLNVVRQLI